MPRLHAIAVWLDSVAWLGRIAMFENFGSDDLDDDVNQRTEMKCYVSYKLHYLCVPSTHTMFGIEHTHGHIMHACKHFIVT